MSGKIDSAISDKQIMGLEILAILIAMHSFGNRLSGKVVRVWSDNVGAECVLRSGYAGAEDHNVIVHLKWMAAADLRCELHFERVASDFNLADEPSRNEFEALRQLGAT